jgi:hypothetical protein
MTLTRIYQIMAISFIRQRDAYFKTQHESTVIDLILGIGREVSFFSIFCLFFLHLKLEKWFLFVSQSKIHILLAKKSSDSQKCFAGDPFSLSLIFTFTFSFYFLFYLHFHIIHTLHPLTCSIFLFYFILLNINIYIYIFNFIHIFFFSLSPISHYLVPYSCHGHRCYCIFHDHNHHDHKPNT